MHSKSLDLTRYSRVLRRWLWLILICPIVAAGLAGVVSLLIPPVYEAHVSVYVRLAQPLTTTDPAGVALTSDAVLRTYASLVTERALLASVSSELGLNIRPEDLAKQITATPVANTTKLDIAVQSTNPELASQLANRLVADLISEVKTIEQQETQLPNARSGDNLVVLSPAVVPDKPIFPNIPLNVAIGFAAGLLIALGLAFLLDYLDQSIKSDEDLTERLGLIPIAHIAFVAPAKGRRSELVALDSQSPAAESYKALRTNLLFSALDEKLKTLVITSSGPGEGKSRTAANLAVVLAHAGHKTVLIDADFRRPSLHKIFGRIRNVGLSNLTVHEIDQNEAVSAVEEVPNLWLITSGPIPPNPSELLSSGRMKELIAQLGREFTYVIMDTPPVNAVTDAAILASAADGTLLVVEHAKTTFPALAHAKQLLDRVGAHTVGTVINKLRASGSPYSYLYEYGSYGSAPEDGAKQLPNNKSESEPTTATRGERL
jgi:succinoglycan biosynthesis transport protein ExoP